MLFLLIIPNLYQLEALFKLSYPLYAIFGHFLNGFAHLFSQTKYKHLFVKLNRTLLELTG